MTAATVLLCGGSPHAHDFAVIGSSLAEALGGETDVVDHPDRLGSLADAELLVVHGLWWRMLDSAYDAWRDDWAYETSAETKTTVRDYVAGGGALLAMHTAPVCFDDWPEWSEILGAGWVWGESSHPPPMPAQVACEPHAITDGLGTGFEIVDEIYGGLDVSPGVDVVARARRSADDEPQPLVWTHRFGQGRIVVDLLGHDDRSLDDPAHRCLLANAVAWLTEEPA